MHWNQIYTEKTARLCGRDEGIFFSELADVDTLIDIANTLDDALEMAAETQSDENIDNDGNVKHSLMRFKLDGMPFVEVDTDQDLFDGLSPDEMKILAAKIIDERYKGKVLGDKYTAFFDEAAREFAYPARRERDEEGKAINALKMRLATELDNALVAGTNFNSDDDGKYNHHHKKYKYFKYLDVIYHIGDRYFKGLINMPVNDIGTVFNGITQVKDVTDEIHAKYGDNPETVFVSKRSPVNESKRKKKNR